MKKIFAFSILLFCIITKTAERKPIIQKKVMLDATILAGSFRVAFFQMAQWRDPCSWESSCIRKNGEKFDFPIPVKKGPVSCKITEYLGLQEVYPGSYDSIPINGRTGYAEIDFHCVLPEQTIYVYPDPTQTKLIVTLKRTPELFVLFQAAIFASTQNKLPTPLVNLVLEYEGAKESAETQLTMASPKTVAGAGQ